jgi:hypothetical protein
MGRKKINYENEPFEKLARTRGRAPRHRSFRHYRTFSELQSINLTA